MRVSPLATEIAAAPAATNGGQYLLVPEVSTIRPRTITEHEIRAWEKQRRFLGGVAVCLLCRDEAGSATDTLHVPVLWFDGDEWANFTSGVKAGALDPVLQATPPGELFWLQDTKQAGRVPWRQDALPLTGATLSTYVQVIKAGGWDNPPERFDSPQSNRDYLPALSEDVIGWGGANYVRHDVGVSGAT